MLPAQRFLGSKWKKLTGKILQTFLASLFGDPRALNKSSPNLPFSALLSVFPRRLLQGQQESPCTAARREIHRHRVDASAQERQNQREQVAWGQSGDKLPQPLVQAHSALRVGQVTVRTACLKVATVVKKEKEAALPETTRHLCKLRRGQTSGCKESKLTFII